MLNRTIVAAGLVAVIGFTNLAAGQFASFQRISGSEGGFSGRIQNADQFGQSVAILGDLDGNGVDDLVVGAPGDDDGGSGFGALWVLFMNQDGTVGEQQKISQDEGGFTGDQSSFGVTSFFAASLAAIGDLDGDSVPDVAVGAPQDDDGGANSLASRGAVWILFLNPDGSVKQHQKISDDDGAFTGALDDSDFFGWSLAELGDLDGDGVPDLAVGAYGDDDGGGAFGAIWILFLQQDGTVRAHQKISETEGGFSGGLEVLDSFGSSVASVGDLDGDDVVDLAVGARGHGITGAVWVLRMNGDGTVKADHRIWGADAIFAGGVGPGDRFGYSAAGLGDRNDDGIPDLAVGSIFDSDGGENRGAVWILYLASDGSVKSHQKVSDQEGGFEEQLQDDYWFGWSLGSNGTDLTGDGLPELLVGAPTDDVSGPEQGAVWLLSLGCAPDQASATFRNTGLNPASYQTTLPVLGKSLVGTVDLTTTGHSFALLLGYATQLSLSLGNGTVLLTNIADPRGELLAQPPKPGPQAVFTVQVPDDSSLCGARVSAQAAHFGGVQPFALSNSQELIVGL